jgi:two-component system sensor histidine kinase UhpB
MKRFQWKSWSIGARLIFITVLPVAMMFSSIVWYSYHTRLAEVQEELSEHGLVIAAALAESSEYGVISGNFPDLERVVKGFIQSDTSIYRIDILDADKREILHVVSPLSSNIDSRDFEVPIRKQLLSMNPFDEDGSPHLSDAKNPMPARLSPEIVGHVRVTMSSSNIFVKQSHRFNVLLMMALLVLAASLLCACYLSRTLTRPMALSIHALRAIRSGNYTTIVDVTAGGEIGDLQSSINDMSVSLNQAKQNLEQKVFERTKALEASRNEALKSDAEKRKLIQKVNSAVEDERNSIAIEIHDELNAALIAARLDSQRILAIAAQSGNRPEAEEIKQKAQSIIRLTLDLYASARNIVRRLRPEALDMLGLHGAVEEMVRHYDMAHPHCRFDFQSAGDFSKLESTLAIAAYRLIQEALSNVVKHAAASKASVALSLNEDEKALHIRVADNGAGFDPDAMNAGIGIIGMRERVHPFDGKLDIDAKVGDGTVITIRLPLTQRSTSLAESPSMRCFTTT